MTTLGCPSYAGHRVPAEIISHAAWLYVRFPLSLRHADEVLGRGADTVGEVRPLAPVPQSA